MKALLMRAMLKLNSMTQARLMQATGIRQGEISELSHGRRWPDRVKKMLLSAEVVGKVVLPPEVKARLSGRREKRGLKMKTNKHLSLIRAQKSSQEGWQPKPILEQVIILAQEFVLPMEDTLAFLEGRFTQAILPPEARGWFAIPVIEAAAESFLPGIADPKERYRKLVELALEKISRKFPQFGDLDCRSTPEKFLLPEKARLGVEVIRASQGGSILVVPIGFGVQADSRNDAFPLGSFFTACLGLTHGERYAAVKSTQAPEGGIECIGFGPVRCHECWFEDARIKWDHATGFIPKFRTDRP